MSKQNRASIKMIPINRINVINDLDPLARNAKVFEGFVHDITQVILKRPITVMPCRSKAVGKDYDLLCDRGLLEAYIACRQKIIPAWVIDASEEQALIMYLMDSFPHRMHKPTKHVAIREVI